MRGKEVKIMPYQKCKIYNDGSHFIAIPHTTRPAVPKRYHPEEVIEVVDDMPHQPQLNADKCNVETDLTALNDTSEVDSGEHSEQNESPPVDEISKPTTTRKITRRQLFDELYEECKTLKKRGREKYIYDRMKKYFANAEAAKQYVDGQFDRLKHKIDSKLNQVKVEYTTLDADYETEHKAEFEKLTESVMETVSEYGCKDTGVSEYRDKIEEYKNAKILFGIKTPAGKESAGLAMGYVSEWHQYYVLEVEGKIEFADFAIFSSSSNNVENEKVNVLDKNRRWFLIDRVDRTELATGNELLYNTDTKSQENPQRQKQVVLYKQKEYIEENLG